MKFKNLNSIKNSKTNLILSIVAILEIIAILVTATYSWIEGESSLIISTRDTTGTLLNDNIDTAMLSKAEINTTDNVIDLSKYFKAAGMNHLSACSSPNGNDFYFPIEGVGSKNDGGVTRTSEFRKGTINDKNVSYISFTFDLQATVANTKFFFESEPVIKVGNSKYSMDAIKYAISCDNTTLVFGNGLSALSTYNAVNSTNADIVNSPQLSSKNYIFNDATHNPGNTMALFALNKGETKKITVSLWFESIMDENFDLNGEELSVEMLIFSTMKEKEKITLLDRSTSSAGIYWLKKNGACMYMTEMGENGNTPGQEFKMKLADDGVTWTANIPKVYSDRKFRFYRCTPAGYGTTRATSESVAGYWGYWDAGNILGSTKTYTVYANTKSDDKGYGTWGEVLPIYVRSADATALKDNADNALDADTLYMRFKGDTEEVSMYCDKTADIPKWITYAPTENSEYFTFRKSGTSITWGGSAYPRGDYTTFYVTGSAAAEGTWYRYQIPGIGDNWSKSANILKPTGTANQYSFTYKNSTFDAVYGFKVLDLETVLWYSYGTQIIADGIFSMTSSYVPDASVKISYLGDAVFTYNPSNKLLTVQLPPAPPSNSKTSVTETPTTKRVYFAQGVGNSNNGWSESFVNLYCWDSNSTAIFGAWPGTRMTATSFINEDKQLLYYADIPLSTQNGIFNVKPNNTDGNNYRQTVDITNFGGITSTTNNSYYINGYDSSNKKTVGRSSVTAPSITTYYKTAKLHYGNPPYSLRPTNYTGSLSYDYNTSKMSINSNGEVTLLTTETSTSVITIKAIGDYGDTVTKTISVTLN